MTEIKQTVSTEATQSERRENAAAEERRIRRQLDPYGLGLYGIDQ